MKSDNATDGCQPDRHFPRIVTDLGKQGWSLASGFLDETAWTPLFMRATAIDDYRPAGVGRGDNHHRNGFVRNDGIFWLEVGHIADAVWLDLMEQLRLAINRALFLGLFEFESHYARYRPGAFYRRHLDAFRGQGNRVVSTVLYLNPDWHAAHGGELVIYPPEATEGQRFLPRAGDLAIFLSEKIPHEVLAARRSRFSIAGWFRMNGSTGERPNPAF
jgi:SM-20-related protein